jgi:hypothetical protein
MVFNPGRKPATSNEIQCAAARTAYLNATVAFTDTSHTVFGFCAAQRFEPTVSQYVLYAVSASGRLFGSIGTVGAAWDLLTADASYASDWTGVISTASKVIAFGASGEIQTASNGGSTWTRRKNGGATIKAIAANRTETVLLAVDAAGHVWESTDAAVTWNDLGAVLSTNAFDIASFSFGDGDIWVVADGSVVKTSSDGTTWATHTIANMQVAWRVVRALFGTEECFVLAGQDTSLQGGVWIASAKDTGTWTRTFTETNGASATCIFATPVPGGVLIGGTNTQARPMFSSDGVTWVRMPRLVDPVSVDESPRAPIQYCQTLNGIGAILYPTMVAGDHGAKISALFSAPV